jgi:hypothetical protein
MFGNNPTLRFPGNLMQVRSINELRGVSPYEMSDEAAILVTAAGLFTFDASSMANDDGASVIRPDGFTPLQSGRWVSPVTVPPSAANTFSTLAALQASGLEVAYLVGDPSEPDGLFIKTGSTLVRQAGNSVSFLQKGAGALLRGGQDKARETVSVLDFGAKGDGVTDDTAAFNAAIATGSRVNVPRTDAGYVVNGIAVVSNMEVVGEKSGECLGPELIVAVNGGCAFLQAATTDIAVHLVFRNLTMRAATGVTGATGFRSADKSKYTAYATFENIETHRNLVWGYDLLPIFTDWINCRDGYLPGNGNFTMTHGFIRAEAATYGQANATNTNNVIRSKVFGCYGVDAAIQIAFGDDWNIIGGRWENMFVPAIKAQSVIGLRVLQNRSEGFHTTEWMTLREMSASGVGSIAHNIDALNAIDHTGFFYAATDALSRVGFERNSFSIVGPDQRLVGNPLALLYNRDHPTISGNGAAGLMTGMQHDRKIAGQALFNGAVPNSNQAITHINLGASAATQGFSSGNAPIAVGADWVTIFTPGSNVARLVVGGVQSSGAGMGTQNAWTVLCAGGFAIEDSPHITPGNGVIAEFRKDGANLQMRCTTGSADVMASGLIS